MAEYENCRLLLVDKKISTARDIVGVLEGAIRGGYPLMIMAEDIEQEALATLVVNKLRGSLKARPAPALHPFSDSKGSFWPGACTPPGFAPSLDALPPRNLVLCERAHGLHRPLASLPSAPSQKPRVDC